MKKQALTIGELSRRSDVPVKTLRFWSDEGLLPPTTRTSHGYRLYAEDATIRLDLVRRERPEELVERQRNQTREAVENKLDMLKLRNANFEAARAAASARAQGAGPDSDAGRAVVEGFLAGIAEAAGRPLDERLRRGMYERYLAYDPRHPRYWELVSIVTGQAAAPGTVANWDFIATAVKVHLAPPSLAR